MIQEFTLPELAAAYRHSIKRGPFGGALKKEIFVCEGFVVYEQQHAIYKRFNDARYYIDQNKYEELEAFKVEEGDLIISCSGTIGKIAEVPKGFKPGIINQALLKVTLDQSKVLNKYFIHLFEGEKIQNQLFSMSHGTGLKNFPPMAVVKSIKFPLPPLEEQKKIAAILDAADEYRQKTKALIDKYDQLTQSLFLDIFGDPVTNPMGWDTNELGEILQITSSKRIFKDEYVEEGIPFYRTKEIVELSKGNKISLELFISEKRYSEIKSKYDIPEKGDILLSAVGTIGIMWTVNTEDPFYFKDGNLVWLKSANLEGVDPTYLRMTLEHLIDYEKYKLAEGGAYNALTIAKLKEFNVLLAPYDLQHLFAERIALIEKQKQQAEASLVKAEELFNSLLQKAFKGELTC